MSEVIVRQAETPADLDAVRDLCWEYRDYLLNYSDEVRAAVAVTYGEQAYAALMDQLAAKHARPKGIILIAEKDGEAVGCGMYHPLNDEDAEIKRVFMRKTARGTGAGQKISQCLVDQARSDGYRRILLDTSRQFVHAQRLYEKLGFVSRGPYSELPPEYVKLLAFYELII
ncbi:GNAT family N-acetyltransferase [uncultured Roseobacter sp.]|uniref:GNAT family N-acetyltransferase n=1 Tax=uncultured Roseobacter sp. TaxID=114847 RepID=UPI002639B64C|nr:GNAT family N-acetyltransferase [uncultured Roseobacter sp.]